MKITEIIITDIGGIKSLNVNFHPKMNLLCGPNGIGKTTILESISHMFASGGTYTLRRNAGADYGEIRAEIFVNGHPDLASIRINSFLPEDHVYVRGFADYSKYLFNIKTNRFFNYVPVPALVKDGVRDENSLYNAALIGIEPTDSKLWFLHRFTYSVHAGALTGEQIANFELAKSCFSILDPKFSFSRVKIDSNDIMVNTPSGEIYFEYLSSGFKSVLSILFGIIKEVELRFKNPTIHVVDFEGVILIDEIELHLHPDWQGRIVEVLNRVFPNAQFILSTHSPHVIQAADPDQIIALEHNDQNIRQRELSNSPYGFKGWTVEEILTDIMGMENTMTATFNSTVKTFDLAIEEEDYVKAKFIFEQIDMLLHPNNHLRKLLKFQLISIAD